MAAKKHEIQAAGDARAYALDHGEKTGFVKVLSKERWFGGGYCKICGDRGEHLVPRAVRFWDPDDGWKMGPLCCFCLDEAAARGPRDDDYAVVVRKDAEEKAQRIDVLSVMGDLDSTYEPEV